MTLNDGNYFDLGKYSRRASTTSQEAQVWLDRGIVWLYAYNHEEAISCFEKSLTHDRQCALAHWGIAYSLGPNYNFPWEAFDAQKKKTVLKSVAEHLSGIDESQISPVEGSLVSALSHRYPKPHDISTVKDNFSKYHDSYANAMREVYSEYPDDLDVCCLTVEALMNRTPWKLWNLKTGLPADGADTAEAVNILEETFQKHEEAWEHPGLLHLYVHIMEMSPHPERALRHGDKLCDLVPDAGHLIHMGTHIDVLCGDYENVVSRNRAATVADRKFAARVGGENFYALYRVHNYHFVVYGAMFLAQPSKALAAADELADNITSGMLRDMPDFAESFVPMRQHVLVRFGMWGDILEQSLPDDPDMNTFTTAMMRYARTIAFANTKNVHSAEEELSSFLEAKSRVPETRLLHNNRCVDILDVAEEMLRGEIEYRKGNFKLGIDHLRDAIEMEDRLPYDEPWGWMQPVRHALGALLLEQGHFEQAEIVYREDLGLVPKLSRPSQHLNNVWSLHGLLECLRHREEKVESIHVKQQLDKAMARAEIPIRASCFCRQIMK